MMTASGRRWNRSWRSLQIWYEISALLGSLDQRLRWQATQHLPPQLHLDPRLTAFHILQHPQLLLATIQLLLEFLVSPLLDLQVLLGSIWVLKEENLRRRGLYCRLVLSERLMEKQGPP